MILVNIDCGDTCAPSVVENNSSEKQCKIKTPCGPICPPPCPPKPPCKGSNNGINANFSILSGGNEGEDEEY